MRRENEELLSLVRKRFADVVAFADEIEELHDEADRLELMEDSARASEVRERIKEAWRDELVAGERYRQEFVHARAQTIYSEFSSDEWQEIVDLDATERELARRLAERAFRSREDI